MPVERWIRTRTPDRRCRACQRTATQIRLVCQSGFAQGFCEVHAKRQKDWDATEVRTYAESGEECSGQEG